MSLSHLNSISSYSYVLTNGFSMILMLFTVAFHYSSEMGRRNAIRAGTRAVLQQRFHHQNQLIVVICFTIYVNTGCMFHIVIMLSSCSRVQTTLVHIGNLGPDFPSAFFFTAVSCHFLRALDVCSSKMDLFMVDPI